MRHLLNWPLIAQHCVLLPWRDLLVLADRYGLVDDEPKSLGVVGRRFGVTRERVRQVEGRALRRLTELAVRDLSVG